MSRELPQSSKNSQSPATKLSNLQLSTLSRCVQQPRQLLSPQSGACCAEEEQVGLEDLTTQRIEDWDDVFQEINNEFPDGPGRGPDEPPKEFQSKEYVFDSVVVKFPYEAYESQLQLMGSLIKGALGGHNCLLESPTGTGKTAALLCSLLGLHEWISRSGNRIKLPYRPSDKCTCGLIPDSFSEDNIPVLKKRMNQIQSGKSSKWTGTIYFDRQESNECLSVTKQPEVEESSVSSPKKKIKTSELEDQPPAGPSSGEMREKSIDEACQYCINKSGAPVKPPKIYYATRTHSQIAQVVNQLKNSPYKDRVCMAVLSSRNQSCLLSTKAIELANSTNENEPEEYDIKIKTEKENPKKPKQPTPKVDNLDDACAVLKANHFYNSRLEQNIANGKDSSDKKGEKKPVCPYYKYGSEFASVYEQVKDRTLDIEDLMKFGEREKCCAFYGSKFLHDYANIAFVPYNYLLYPHLREAVKIELEGSIVVFDEAHNIEDVCRDASSCDIDLIELENHLHEIEYYMDLVERTGLMLAAGIFESLQYMSVSLTSLKSWINTEMTKLNEKALIRGHKGSYNESGYAYGDLEKLFTNAGLGANRIVDNPGFNDSAFLVEESNGFTDDPSNCDDEGDEKNTQKSDSPLSKKARQFVQYLIQKLKFVYQNPKDFVMVLKRKGTSDRNFMLSFKCLNPALAFQSLANKTLSVVVASGTLSPQTSFEGELQTKFAVKLSASHVVKEEQVLKMVLRSGVGDELFKLNQNGQENIRVQDDIGRSILEICKVVPNGILVFMPSYKFLKVLKARWTTQQKVDEDPLLSQISRVKAVFFEESLDKEKFKSEMRDFKTIACGKSGRNDLTGAILFAVYRGKVSEGIDFSDEQARAVITVGIPYPPARGFEISSKKDYNDKAPALLSGNDWYNVQAYRAINQSFGRCIRHKDDWGAIILMDSRFSFKSEISSQVKVSRFYAKNLSNWVQNGLETSANFRQARSKLGWFMQDRLRKTHEAI